MRLPAAAAGGLGLLLAAASARAAGRTAAEFLTLGAGAPAYESGATGPTARGAAGADWNPAGIAGTSDAYAAHELLPLGVSFDYLAACAPSDALAGTVGLSVRSLIQGGIPQLDNQGASEGTFSARDLAVAGTWAQDWGEDRIGVTARVLDSSIAQTSAKGFAADAGWQRRLSRGSAGISVSNVGPGLVMASQSYPLPAALRAGAAWEVGRGFTLAGAYVQSRDSGPTARLGASWRAAKLATFGLGYQVGDTNAAGFGGFSAGASLELGRARVDVGYQAFGLLGSVFQLGLGYRFASPARRAAAAVPAEPELSQPPDFPAEAAPAAPDATGPALSPDAVPPSAALPEAPYEAPAAHSDDGPPPPDPDRFAHDW